MVSPRESINRRKIVKEGTEKEQEQGEEDARGR